MVSGMVSALGVVAGVAPEMQLDGGASTDWRLGIRHMEAAVIRSESVEEYIALFAASFVVFVIRTTL